MPLFGLISGNEIISATARIVVVIFGLMATGKTTLARTLGQALGWPVIESDRVRKSLAGMKPTTRAAEEFGRGIYAAVFSMRTYEEMRRQAGERLAAGESVILDGSYKRAEERELVQQLAKEYGAETLFIYCECSPAEARRRAGIRLSDPQAISDGRVELFESQAKDFDPPGPEDRPLLRLNTDRELALALEELQGFVESYL
jgi:predicted kinase